MEKKENYSYKIITPVSPLIFRENAPDLDDRQVLEYILSLTATTKKNEVVVRLLETFGSLKNILEARPEQLKAVKGIGDKTANLISSFVPVMRAWKRSVENDERFLRNSYAAKNYCQSLLAGERNEQFWVICVNSNCRLLGKRRISEGSLTECNAYPRLIMETALNYNAHSVIFAHNHPGGSALPSSEDIASTNQMQRMLASVGIAVLDHFIVVKDDALSMREERYIDKTAKPL